MAQSKEKPKSTNVASTSKDKSIAHPGTRTISTEASRRHYQGEASSSMELFPRTQRSSGECQTIWVTRKQAIGVLPRGDQSPAGGRARRRNPTVTEVACGHDFTMREEQQTWTKYINAPWLLLG